MKLILCRAIIKTILWMTIVYCKMNPSYYKLIRNDSKTIKGTHQQADTTLQILIFHGITRSQKVAWLTTWNLIPIIKRYRMIDNKEIFPLCLWILIRYTAIRSHTQGVFIHRNQSLLERIKQVSNRKMYLVCLIKRSLLLFYNSSNSRSS